MKPNGQPWPLEHQNSCLLCLGVAPREASSGAIFGHAQFPNTTSEVRGRYILSPRGEDRLRSFEWHSGFHM